MTEDQSLRVRCPHCAALTPGAFPATLRAPAPYGPRLRALTMYLTHRQLLPLGRARAVLRDLRGGAVSHGLVAAMAHRAPRQRCRLSCITANGVA